MPTKFIPKLENRVHTSEDEGHIVVQGGTTYAMFQTGLLRPDSLCLGKQWFTYGRLITKGFRLARNSHEDLEFRKKRLAIDARFGGRILVMPETEVDAYVSALDSDYRTPPESSLPVAVETLYQTIKDREIEGVAFDACATFGKDARGNHRLAIVGDSGGFAAGYQPVAGQSLVRPQLLQLAG
jgi:hypothetical protein